MNRVLLRAVVAVCASALMLLGAAPALAGDANAGDVWVDTFGAPPGPGHEMDPHLPCGNISLWGSGLADSSGSYTIDGWAPSGSQEKDYGPSTWSYSGSGTKLLDVIDVNTLINNAVANGDAPVNKQGFHFKLQFSQDPQKHKTFWVNCTVPTMTTHAVSATLGQMIHDTATISGSNAATGTITWNVYNLASDPTCMDPLNGSPMTAVTGNGTYDSPDYHPTSIGTYQWVATYSGDAKNLSVVGRCGDTREQSVVSAASSTNPPGTNPPGTGKSSVTPATVSLHGVSVLRCPAGMAKTTTRRHGKPVVVCAAKKGKKHLKRRHHRKVVVVRRKGPEFTG